MKFSLPTLCASGIVLGLLGLAGCKSDSSASGDANQIAFNDFESLDGWASNTESLTKEQAHSGKYAISVNPNVEFGMNYMMVLNKVFDHKPRKLRVSAWGYMADSKSTAQLDIQLFDLAQGKAVFGEAIDYAAAVKTPGKWVEISKEVTLPATRTPAAAAGVLVAGGRQQPGLHRRRARDGGTGVAAGRRLGSVWAAAEPGRRAVGAGLRTTQKA